MQSAPNAASQSGDGRAPSIQIKVAPSLLYVPEPSAHTSGKLTVEPQVSGPAPYTSTRVYPMFGSALAGYSTDRDDTHKKVGKLFFTVGGSPYVCSASVIQARVVATAAHCVHGGTSAGFHDNFVFVPAFRDGVAPFKQWTWRYVVIPPVSSVIPNPADYAMIEFGDQAITTGGPIVKLGHVTGWLGWKTHSLTNNHTSKLGYPCNLDNCQKMQNVMSGAYRAVAPNSVEYGPDALGGSSGGPWVENLGVQAVRSGGTGLGPRRPMVVGITSYGYADPVVQVQGSSILDSRWTTIFTMICARPGNCS